ncbi:MAG: T9SS type A sorting domain-containing protein, partial [Flavobacteriaceae bacterium]|nr:T9SS type A sorting domain-containing protein [Flavobacteriaceae bacterium]
GPLQLYVGGSDRNVGLSVTSLQGSTVYSTDLSVGASRFSAIDLSHLSSGVYIVSLKSASINTSHKIIKD